MTDTRLDILHDHYKESFAHIREREKERNRLFLILIALFALLALEIQYPINFQGALSTIKVLDIEVDLSALPLPAFLVATWVFVLALTLRYCQTSIHVERQYEYIHMLETKISSELGDDDLYRREGMAYESNYPLFSWWAWRFYVVLLPIIVTLATVVLIYQELTGLQYPLLSQVLDVFLASGVVISFVFYRIVPLVWAAVKRIKERLRAKAF